MEEDVGGAGGEEDLLFILLLLVNPKKNLRMTVIKTLKTSHLRELFKNLLE